MVTSCDYIRIPLITDSPETGVFGSSLDRLIVLDNNRRGSGMIVGSHHSVPNVPIVFQQVIMSGLLLFF